MGIEMDSTLEFVTQNILNLFISPFLKEKYIELKCIPNKMAEESLFTFTYDILRTYFWEKVDTFKSVCDKNAQNMYRTKKRWFDACVKEANSFSPSGTNSLSISAELNLWVQFYKTKKSLEECQRIFKALSFEDYTVQILSEIEQWASNKDTFMIEYRYIQDKSMTYIDNALTLDFQKELINIIKNRFDSTFCYQYVFTSYPAMILSQPFFSDRPGLMKPTQIKELPDNEQLVIEDYPIDTHSFSRVTLTLSPQSKKPTLLDERDMNILKYLLQHRDEEFYSTGRVIVDMGQLVSAVYKSKSKFDYMNCEERLDKIVRYNASGIINNLDKEFNLPGRYRYMFFSSLVVDIDPVTKKRFASVVFSPPILEDMIQKNLISFYSPFLDSLSYVGKLLAIAFQKIRKIEYNPEDTIDKTRATTSNKYLYEWFRSIIRFKSKNKNTNLDIIETGLEELRNKSLIVKDYSRNPEGFVIELYPLSKKEYDALFNSEYYTNYLSPGSALS